TSATNITFSSIPGTYKHLRLVVSLRGDGATAADDLLIQVNGDTGSNYNYQRGTFSSTSSASQSAAQPSIGVGAVAGANAAANVVGAGEALLLDYASTSLFKALTGNVGVADNTAANSLARDAWGSWRST